MPIPLYQLESESEFRETESSAGFIYGYGCFTTFLAEKNSEVFRLERHFSRLVRDSQFLNMKFPFPPHPALSPSGGEGAYCSAFSLFEKMVYRFIDQKISEPQVVRITITVKDSMMHSSVSPMNADLSITLRAVPSENKPAEATLIRFDRLFPEVKHMSHIAENIYLREAKAKEFNDYIRLSGAGYIAEASYANLFMVTDEDCLLTPDTERSGSLPGIMREAVIKACRDLGISVSEALYYPEILKNVKGAFLTNAVRGPYPVSRIDDYFYDISAIQPLLSVIRGYLRSFFILL